MRQWGFMLSHLVSAGPGTDSVLLTCSTAHGRILTNVPNQPARSNHAPLGIVSDVFLGGFLHRLSLVPDLPDIIDAEWPGVLNSYAWLMRWGILASTNGKTSVRRALGRFIF